MKFCSALSTVEDKGREKFSLSSAGIFDSENDEPTNGETEAEHCGGQMLTVSHLSACPCRADSAEVRHVTFVTRSSSQKM